MSKAKQAMQSWDNSTRVAKEQKQSAPAHPGRAQAAAKNLQDIQVSVANNVYVRTSTPEHLEAIIERLHDPKGKAASDAAALITRACTVEGISKTKKLYQAVQLLKDVGKADDAAALEALTKIPLPLLERGKYKTGYVNPSDSLEKAKGLFKNSLQSAIWSGIIPAGNRKEKQAVTGHSQLICLDFDKIPSAHLQIAKFTAALEDHSILTFYGPSMDGFKCVVWVDFDFSVVTDWSNDDYHKAVYDQVKRHYESLLFNQGIKADISCDNVNRHCFLPYRPKASLNTAADPLKINSEEVYEIIDKARERRADDRKEALKRLAELESLGIDIDPTTALNEARRTTDRFSEFAPYESGKGRHYYTKDFILNALKLGVQKADVYEYCESEFTDIAARGDFDYTNAQNIIEWSYKAHADKIGKDLHKLVKEAPAADLERLTDWKPKTAAQLEPFLYFPKNPIRLGDPRRPWFGQYIKEAMGIIKKYPFTIFVSPTNRGKTQGSTKQGEIWNDGTLFNKETIEKTRGLAFEVAKEKAAQVFICMPVKMLGKQKAKGATIPYIDGDTPAEERRKILKTSRVIITTFATVPNIAKGRFFLFIDEMPSLVDDGFKDKGERKDNHRLWECMGKAQGVIGLTATPSPLMDLPENAPRPGCSFKYVFLDLPHRNKLFTNSIFYTGNAARTWVPYLAERIKKEPGKKFLVRVNSIDQARAAAAELAARNAMTEGKRAYLLNSKTQKETYFDTVLNDSTLPGDAAVVFFTCIGDVGLDYKDKDIAEMLFIVGRHGASIRDTRQAAKRAREIDLMFTIFLPDREPEEWKGSLMNEYRRHSKGLIDEANGYNYRLSRRETEGENTLTSFAALDSSEFMTDRDGRAKPFLLAAIREAERAALAAMDRDTFLSAFLAEEPAAELQAVYKSKGANIPTFDKKLWEIREERRICDGLLGNELLKDQNVVFAVYLYAKEAGKEGTARKIKEVFGETVIMDKALEAYKRLREGERDLLEGSSLMYVNSFCELRAKGMTLEGVKSFWRQTTEADRAARRESIEKRKTAALEAITAAEKANETHSENIAKNRNPELEDIQAKIKVHEGIIANAKERKREASADLERDDLNKRSREARRKRIGAAEATISRRRAMIQNLADRAAKAPKRPAELKGYIESNRNLIGYKITQIQRLEKSLQYLESEPKEMVSIRENVYRNVLRSASNSLLVYAYEKKHLRRRLDNESYVMAERLATIQRHLRRNLNRPRTIQNLVDVVSRVWSKNKSFRMKESRALSIVESLFEVTYKGRGDTRRATLVKCKNMQFFCTKYGFEVSSLNPYKSGICGAFLQQNSNYNYTNNNITGYTATTFSHSWWESPGAVWNK